MQSEVGVGSTFWVELRKSQILHTKSSLLTRFLALGVGNKAIPAIISPTDQYTLIDMHTQRFEQADQDMAKSLMVSAGQTFRASTSRSSSALHSIMEQGGLVEISTNRDEIQPILTRTIGDPSTGTEPSQYAKLDSPPPSPLIARPTVTPEDSNETAKPPHLGELPKPPHFSLDHGVTSSSTPQSSSSHQHSTSISMPSRQSGAFERGMRVLVVDDDPLTRTLMSRMLTRMGCKVVTAENGMIALDLILGQWPTPSSEDTGSGGLSVDSSSASATEEPRYAVVFLDNQMPVLSGLGVVAKLRELGRHDFVVGVTGAYIKAFCETGTC